MAIEREVFRGQRKTGECASQKNCLGSANILVLSYVMSSAKEENPRRVEVDRFILDEIDSVPHIEALLILWNHRPKPWTVDALAALLYLPEERTRQVLEDLRQRSLVASVENGSTYNPGHPRDHLMEDVDRTWRRELVRLSNLIHSKASPAVREFARAFRFKKDQP